MEATTEGGRPPRNVLERLVAWIAPRHWARTHPHHEIVVGADAFEIIDGARSETIAYGSIVAIGAYKIDQITVDLVCWDVETDGPDGVRTRTLYEDIDGFEAFGRRCAALPGFDAGWWGAVAFPPFADNRQVIYRREIAIASETSG